MSTTTGHRRRKATAYLEYEQPTRPPRLDSPILARLIMVGVFLAWLAATATAATAVVDVDAPAWAHRPAAAVLLIIFTVGLTHRGGGHLRIWGVMSVLLAGGAVVAGTNVVVAGATGATAVLATVWSILLTRPARGVVGAFREYVVALAVASSGALAVAAWNAPVSYPRFNLVVLTVSLTLAIGLVWNLGAGLHGLGRQGLAMLIGVAAVLVLVLTYSSFVRTYGSETLIGVIDDAVLAVRAELGGVPRPVQVLVGFPALVVGVALRSRRREGWWVLVFAVLGTGVMTTSLVSPGALPTYIGLSAAYSAGLGFAVGLVLRFIALQGRSKRAARAIEPETRVEPPRLAPLK